MKHITKKLEYPSALQPYFAKAVRYEWISFIYMISATLFSFLAMSNSQTMKTVWLEDALGIIPPLSFLIASKIINWKPNKTFPYGYHEATGIAFLSSSLALFILGIYLLIDSSLVLWKQEHPDIPTIHLFNHSIWFGYIMIIALLWSSIPSTFLGHVKIPLAKKIYDKILFTDSKMNKASWMTGFASILGITGIGLGYWWADATVGIIISLDIIYDGFSNLKQSIYDLMNEVPKEIGSNKTDPLLKDVEKVALQHDWVQSAEVRARDDGHIYFAEVFLQTNNKSIEINKLKKLEDEIKKLSWRLHDVVISLYSND